MPDEGIVGIEVFGEGGTDLGPQSDDPGLPDRGVVPILLRKLCGDPVTLRVKRKPIPLLSGKNLEQKVEFAKRQAFYNRSSGIVFVVDTEGEGPAKHLAKLRAGRDAGLPNCPAAVGVAHPCIEAWLLADTGAIFRAMGLGGLSDVPERPEDLPAPRHDRSRNSKIALASCVGVAGAVSTKHTSKIAEEIRDPAVIRTRCPLGFAPFAEEVESRILPLFGTDAAAGETPP